jgi:hypothetical protein
MYTRVADIPVEFELVTRDIVIDAILEEDLETEYTSHDYGCLFILQDDNENYIAVYGTDGIVPNLHTLVDMIMDRRIKDGTENQDEFEQPSLWG